MSNKNKIKQYYIISRTQYCFILYKKMNSYGVVKGLIVYSGDNLKQYIDYIDAQIELHPFQEELELHYDVLCNDCSFQGQSKFHPFGMKCGGCGGYNVVKK